MISKKITRSTLLSFVLAVTCAAPVFAQNAQVINPDAWFAEGPIWYQNKLFYVEYGRNTVMTWDGTKNAVFWQRDGCGPSAVLPTSTGDFVVTCYDSNSIGRISADDKTLEGAVRRMRTRLRFPGEANMLGHADFAPLSESGVTVQLEIGAGREAAFLIEMVEDRRVNGCKLL